MTLRKIVCAVLLSAISISAFASNVRVFYRAFPSPYYVQCNHWGWIPFARAYYAYRVWEHVDCSPLEVQGGGSIDTTQYLCEAGRPTKTFEVCKDGEWRSARRIET